MRVVKSLAGLAIVAASLAIAVPAGAHNANVTGVASCSNGSHLVTWTITNDLAKKPMSVSATSVAEGVAYDVSVVTNPVPGGGSTEATTVVPGEVTGTITITVVGTWPDDFSRTVTATVGLPDKCTPTETTVPPTTVPPTIATTTTAVAGVTSTLGPTTTAVAGVECGPDTLACTGSSDTGAAVAVGLGLVAAGAGLVALRRRPARTH
jgi:LPXTG-motif cell wall-anchored protein